MRALRDSWQEAHVGRKDFPIYFITASPPQLERKIHDKLAFDGIYPFGLFCKDNLRNLAPGRLWRLTQQVGYKLQALLQLRLHLGPEIRQILWGDDSEADAVIYSLYSDLCARRLEERDARQVLRHYKVTGEQVETILQLLEEVPKQDPVERIYINLAADTDPDYYLKFGRRMLPTSNTFQLALDLFQENRLSPNQVTFVALDLVHNYGFSQEELERSFEELVQRPILSDKTVQSILPVLLEHKVLRPDFNLRMQPRAWVAHDGARPFELEGVTEPWVSAHIDYMRDDR